MSSEATLIRINDVRPRNFGMVLTDRRTKKWGRNLSRKPLTKYSLENSFLFSVSYFILIFTSKINTELIHLGRLLQNFDPHFLRFLIYFYHFNLFTILHKCENWPIPIRRLNDINVTSC